MTYERIYNLKFRKRVPTYRLRKQFPNEARKIARIALLQLPENLLKKLLAREKNELERIRSLRADLKEKNLGDGKKQER